ncbi:MAG: LacI family transcriptional regulator [Clostridiales bacterium]|jgi:LacI family transcriptional regulator|nr:LacI family transcriptional regulator [Clostridiales bacterium]
MTTLKTIAEEAGVSVMTVSRVVNDIPSRVSDAKRRQIKDIIERTGYVPNSSARSLSSRFSKLIAIILPYSYNALDYPHNAQMVGYISRFIQDMDYTPLVYQVKDYYEVTKRLRSWKVDGAIFLGMFDSDMKNIKEDNRIPLVFTDSYSTMRQVTNVGLDDYKGGELAAEYLLNMGHRNVAFVGEASHESPVVRARLQGFASVLRDAGVKLPVDNLLPDIPSQSEIRTLCGGDEPVTAFFAHADITAIQLMKELRAADLDIPKDCSVMGFDNLQISELCYPALTTIGQNIEKKASIATNTLFQHITNPENPAQNVVLDVHLVERESVRRIPV